MQQMDNIIQNLKHGIYPEATQYLTEQRGLSLETLKKFRVGVGSERFRDDETGNLKLYDSVYFPLYREATLKKSERAALSEQEYPMKTEFCEPVRFKVRGVGKENKSKQRFTPNTHVS